MTELEESLGQAEAYFKRSYDAACRALRLYHTGAPEADLPNCFHIAAREANEAAYAYGKMALALRREQG